MSDSPKLSDGKEANKKDKLMENVLREEQELVSVATAELTKVKRQLRQTRNELKTWLQSNRKTVEKQEKAIALLEKEKKDSQMKWALINQAKKPPTATINLLVDRYHKARQQSEEMKSQLKMAKEELKAAQIRHHSRGKDNADDYAQHSSKMQDGRRKLDQVMIQYNKILANNMQSRLKLQEMLRIKEEFNKHLSLLEQDYEKVSTGLDKLYEETTAYYKQREEFRLKLNLLQERLEKTRTQGQREIREYRRLLNNDEKLNCFLAQKNKMRSNFDESQVLQDVSQNVCDEQMTQKDVQEWVQLFTEHYGHAQFGTVVDQYLHNLEHSYVLYGLIAQKNNEIDQLEDTISNLERKLEPPVSDSKSNNTSKLSSGNQMQQVLAIFQNILHAVDLQFHLPQNHAPLLVQCQQSCDLLSARIASLLSLVANKSVKTDKVEQCLEIISQKSVDSLEDSFSFEIPPIDV